MSSEIAAVADAVKDALNDAVASSGLSQTFAAERVFVPAFDLTDIETLAVKVVPHNYDRANSSRASVSREIPIDIGIAKRVTQGCNPVLESANVELDAHLLLVEEIARLFDNIEIDVEDARWLRTEVPSFYDVEKLKNDRTLLTVVRVTFTINN